MTKEIIQMARDSGMELYGLGKDRARFVHHLEAFAKLVAEAEREACADMLEHGYIDDEGHHLQYAKEIRARGQA
jgi:hypothetical protein